MLTFSSIDIIIISLFLAGVLITGFLASRGQKGDEDSFLLSGRKMGLLLFIMTNVSTWYGGILGVGEFTYRYGIMNWFTQGLPYYVFALIFAFLLAGRIRGSGLFTIPEKIESAYGKTAGMIAAIIVFILVSPAPYILMIGTIISMIFHINLFISLIIGLILTIPYLLTGGYKSDLYTDVFAFIIMFGGFAFVIIMSMAQLGPVHEMISKLPQSHLNITGGASPAYLIVWFLIALWTFVDPGFHQRCYAAKNPQVAKKGILISIVLWMIFDILTTMTGLYAKAYMPEMNNPVMAFPLFAEYMMGPGIKGVFYAAMLATILSTLNSFLFISAGTFSKDILMKLLPKHSLSIKQAVSAGMIVSAALALILAYFFPSVVQLWYLIGSICIPGMLLPVIASYYRGISIPGNYTAAEMIIGISVSILWYMMRSLMPQDSIWAVVEPMIAGLSVSLIFHTGVLVSRKHLHNMK